MSKHKDNICRWRFKEEESKVLERSLKQYMLDLLGDMCGEFEDGGKYRASVVDSSFMAFCEDYKVAARILQKVEERGTLKLERYDLITVKESLNSYIHNMVELQHEIESTNDSTTFSEREKFADEMITADFLLEKCLGILDRQKLHIVATDGNGKRHDLGVFPPQNA